jgi:UDP-N-acetylmuramoyl-L-alanyl-D-glutamate--2,6-diaminopimelate ligase
VTVSVPAAALRDAVAAAGELREVRGTLPGQFAGVTDDSRQVQPGMLFMAVRGHDNDGHDFLADAARRGASAAMVEDASGTELPCLVIRDSRRASAVVASAAFGHPGARLELVGVTGTNGKTTTVGMLRHLLHDDTAPAASIGTLGVLVGSRGEPLSGGSGLTTPGPVELQRVLRSLGDAGVRRVAMEVSSHSLEQRRVEGLRFAAAVFTNLTHEHLDYHGTMEAYRTAKARLLAYLAVEGVLVVNGDDEAWEGLDPGGARRIRFGLSAPSPDVTARDVRYGSAGSAWTLIAGGQGAVVSLPLVGDFNVMNALAAAGAAWGLGIDVATIAARLSSVPQVPGRLERVLDHPTVLRDYAHKPHALESALRAVRPFTPGRMIVVFGCGGDRDRAKRPLMGAIAEREADAVILTSDNPRTEDPERILDEIEAGMTRPHVRVEDRREAIARALDMAGPADVIVLAGKGHETYQIRGTTRLPFDEREIVRELAGARSQGGPAR